VGALGRATGKLILFGEHSAVHGHAAIGISLPERVTVRFTGGSADAWDLGRVPPDDRSRAAEVLARIRDTVTALSARSPAGIEVESDVPRGVGFGSSAAFCAAFVRAALSYAGETVTTLEREWRLSHEAERIFHGTPSGIDTGLALIGGATAFHPSPPALPRAEPLPSSPLHLVVAAVPRGQSCAALVASVGQRMRDGDRVTREAIAALGGLAETALAALRDGTGDKAPEIGATADRAMAHLRLLGLSTPALDKLLDAGRLCGALGGKLSGAGAGGAFFLVARDALSAKEIEGRLTQEAERRGIRFASAPRVL
jgi:mevalonate kinase